MELTADLPPELLLSLAWQPAATRSGLATLFVLDQRLAQVVGRAREPILAQMRFAWWREGLGAAASGQTHAEPLLSEIERSWSGRAEALSGLVDGWEARLLDAERSDAVTAGRGEALSQFAELSVAAVDSAAIGEIARRWTLAESLDRPPQRVPPLPRFPRMIRGLAVLGSLATMALLRGEPMLATRQSTIYALRAGLLGR